MLVAGGRVPYVLRAVQHNDAADRKGRSPTTSKDRAPPAYTFIGDAYIQGIMQGERWDEEKLERFHLV